MNYYYENILAWRQLKKIVTLLSRYMKTKALYSTNAGTFPKNSFITTHLCRKRVREMRLRAGKKNCFVFLIANHLLSLLVL